ncbi:MAG: thioesterase family protein [Novosphingobium sp.]
MPDSLPAPFTYRFRVRYAEVDPQSVVFNSRYLEYADLLITEHWRACGVHFAGDDSLEFHVVRAEVDFRSPIRVDEWVEGRVWTDRVGTSSVTTRIELHGADENAEQDLRAVIVLVHVHVDLASGKPMPVPPPARLALGASE